MGPAAFAVVGILGGIVVSVILGNPMFVVVGIVAGAIGANRTTYRGHARAIGDELRRDR